MTILTTKPVVFSGVQPSGVPSLGNLLGAFVPFAGYIKDHTTFFCVVDHHAITVRQDPVALRHNTLSLVAWYIAAGLDPDQCVLFVQSHVPAHAELGWVLTTFAQMGELERMTQFKDKAQRNKQNINAGLFSYPALMAADILLYQTQLVPVGEDQLQHIELCRDVAVRFNNAFGKTFTLPKGVNPPAGARVRDLQEPTRKMSKSLPGPGTILLTDTPAEAAKKMKKAVTDDYRNVAYDPERQPGLANLLEIAGAALHADPRELAEKFAGDQYGPLKNAAADAVVALLEPLQAKHAALMADEAALLQVLAKGAAKARAVANVTLAEVYDKLGYVRLS